MWFYLAAGPRTLTVQSGGQASMNVISGGSNDAVVTISAGADKDAKLVFVDPARLEPNPRPALCGAHS